MTSATAPATPDRRRGLTLAFGAAAVSSLGLIPFKLATRDAEPQDIVVVVLLAAAIVNIVIGAISTMRARRRTLTAADRPPEHPHHRLVSRTSLGVALVMGVLAAVANYGAGQGLLSLDASVSALLIQMQVLFAAALGWAWLREAVSMRFALGTAIAVAGVAAIPEGGNGGVALAGVAWTLLAAACFGVMQVVVRRYIDDIDVMVVNGLRLWVAVVGVALVPGAVEGALDLDGRVALLAALAGMGGPVIGRLLLMFSARHVAAATSTLIGLSSPAFALIGDWLVLDGVPGLRAWIGGLLVGIGIFVAVRTSTSPTRAYRPDRRAPAA